MQEKSEEMIYLPASKSVGARYLVATFFAGTLPADPVFDDCEDLNVLQQALLNIYADEEPIDYGETPLDVGASGTAFRFVTAVCASTPGADFVVTGTPRLCQRPMKPLIDVLREAGADIEKQGAEGTGPYRVKGGVIKGGEFSIWGDVSSQFISALMLVAPVWEKGVKLTVTGEIKSWPYIRLTAYVMERFGIKVRFDGNIIEVRHSKYVDPEDFRVEADWSAASFFYEGVLLSGNPVRMAGLLPPQKSIQGDSCIVNIMQDLGVVSIFEREGVFIKKERDYSGEMELDLSQTPDLAPVLTVSLALAGYRFHFKGVAALRHKESDRLVSLKEGLWKLGYVVHFGEDYIEWKGETDTSPDKGDDLIIQTFDDHRIAMSFAMAAFKTGEVRIKNPQTVAKSFERFWQELPKMGLQCIPEDDYMLVRKI